MNQTLAITEHSLLVVGTLVNYGTASVLQSATFPNPTGCSGKFLDKSSAEKDANTKGYSLPTDYIHSPPL